MAINPLRLKPTEVLRLLNSTPVGTVTGERLLRRHRDAAGMNISDDAGQTVNIFKYAAWLTRRWLERDDTLEQYGENPSRFSKISSAG